MERGMFYDHGIIILSRLSWKGLFDLEGTLDP